MDKKFAKFFCSATNPLAAGEGNRLYDIIYRVYIGDILVGGREVIKKDVNGHLVQFSVCVNLKGTSLPPTNISSTILHVGSSPFP